jgi:transposase
VARPFQIDWEEDEQRLYELYKQAKAHQNRTRLQALWLLRQGRPLRQVAEIVGVHYRTLQEWVTWYRQGGVTEVLRHWHGGHGGQERRLTSDQEAELKAKAASGEIRTIHEGVAWVKQSYGVEYSYWGMRWVFDRLELRPKVPRPRSPQASVPQQEAWKKGG